MKTPCTIGTILLLSLTLLRTADGAESTVVVYVSEDQVFSEPILKDFERDTGIRVKAVYDTEETKGTGVMNRLIAEKNNPQSDVYWANEPIRAEVLKQKKISAAYRSPNSEGIPAAFKDSESYWTGFSARARVFIVNRKAGIKPDSLKAYVDPKLAGKGIMANPLFGTTATHVAALFTVWGDDRAKQFMDALKNNGTQLASSNGESADLVAAGEFDFALVDSDDAVNRIRQGKAVEMVCPDQGKNQLGCLILPNAAVLIRNSPHPDAGRKLVDYLLSKETERKLAFADCAQIPLHGGIETPKDVPSINRLTTMQVEYGAVASKLQAIQPWLKQW
ncbi:MAG: extracellular solute-binding protein [Methyloglobulus sp.]|nr:extracellular solute-binding protein [Methyloglobulus sp.]